MARSTRRSLAGQAASVARKVISRRSSEPTEAPTAKKTASKAAKKTVEKEAAAPAKKVAAKKAPAAKAPATKAAAKKTPAAKAPAKKAPATKAPAKNASARKAPVTKAAATKTAATKTAKKTVATKTAATKAPAKKSSAAKRTAAAALVVKPGESAWTKTELAEVLAELHEQSAHSAAIVSEQEAELSGLMRDSGDGAGHDQADVGATSFERDHEMTVLSIERDKLAQIEHALSRIDDGTYGVCETCGEPVGKMRLMAFPRATLCMTCKQREERR